MDEKEDGEISEENEDSFGLSYKPVSRPDTSQYRPVAQHVPSSDDDYTSDSDLDTPLAPKRKRPNVSKMETCPSESHNPKGLLDNGTEERTPALKAKRRNTVWSAVMQEQVLAQEIGGFGLKKRLDTGDRNVETYDYIKAMELRGLRPHYSEDDDDEEEETEETKNKRQSRKRHIRDRLSYHKPKSGCGHRELVNVEETDDMTDQDLGYKLAQGLMERKPELIVRVVEVMGRAKALQVYKQTQEVERDGGLMIMNGSRRRTSGGVYLQLIKSWPGVGRDELARIFPPPSEDDAGRHQQWGRREKAHRKRERHESKPQSESVSEEGLHLGDLFSDDPGGTKCPGSTPVTTPQHSDTEADDLAAPLINKLSPSALPELIPPSSTSPPPAPKTDSPTDLPRTQPAAPLTTPDVYNGEFVDIGEADPRAQKERSIEAYDEDFLEIHTNEEMELF